MDKKEYRLFTLKEVEEILSVSQRTLYTWIKEGKLETIKVGRQHRVRQEELDRILEGK